MPRYEAMNPGAKFLFWIFAAMVIGGVATLVYFDGPLVLAFVKQVVLLVAAAVGSTLGW